MQGFSQAHPRSGSRTSHSQQLSWGGWAECWWSWGPRGAFRKAHVCEGRKGRSNGDKEQLSVRQVGNGTLSGCAVCAVTFWESSPGPRPDGSRLPGISWSCLLDAAQLGAAGSDKHTPWWNGGTGVLMQAVGPDPLCSALPAGCVWSSALLTERGEMRHSGGRSLRPSWREWGFCGGPGDSSTFPSQWSIPRAVA